MNVVIYSADLQPITVVSLDISQYQQACKWDDFLLQNKNVNGQALRIKVRALKIKAPDGSDQTLFWTHDEAGALGAVNHTWLPGQRRSINNVKKLIWRLKRL